MKHLLVLFLVIVAVGCAPEQATPTARFESNAIAADQLENNSTDASHLAEIIELNEKEGDPLIREIEQASRAIEQARTEKERTIGGGRLKKAKNKLEGLRARIDQLKLKYELVPEEPAPPPTVVSGDWFLVDQCYMHHSFYVRPEDILAFPDGGFGIFGAAPAFVHQQDNKLILLTWASDGSINGLVPHNLRAPHFYRLSSKLMTSRQQNMFQTISKIDYEWVK